MSRKKCQESSRKESIPYLNFKKIKHDTKITFQKWWSIIINEKITHLCYTCLKKSIELSYILLNFETRFLLLMCVETYTRLFVQ